MKFRKIAAVLLVAAMAVTTLAGCGASSASAAGDDKTVTIWAEGSDNVRVQLEQQVENFNETNGEGYVAKLEFITSGTGAQGLTDRIIAAKKAGQTNTDYDLVEVSDASITGYLEQGGEDLFVPIDTSRLSNYDNLTVTASFRNDLLVPYRGTTVLLAYNSETVANPPTTAEELYQWIKDNPGRFAYNTPGSGGAGSSFVLTSVYNFMDESALTSTDEAGIRAVKGAAPLYVPVLRQGGISQQKPGNAGSACQQGNRYDARLGRYGSVPAEAGNHAGIHQARSD